MNTKPPAPKPARRSPRLPPDPSPQERGEELKKAKRRGKMDRSKDELVNQLKHLSVSLLVPTGAAVGPWPTGAAVGPWPTGAAVGPWPTGAAVGPWPTGAAVGPWPTGAAVGPWPTGAVAHWVTDTQPGTYGRTSKDHHTEATLAVGSLLQLVDKVMTSELRNGFSVARPPGHHAQHDQANGYSLFNNIAIATRYAQRRHRVSRVLVVDWDVHHGQGIQYAFQEDPRYEHGGFWPHLQDSDSAAAGSGPGLGYTINLPWNKTGMSDADYIAAFQQLLLPVAYEFQPQLVLVAAGFDCVLGDPKGEMNATPPCFSLLTRMLMGLAEGRGGYNLRSTAEGAAACLSSLLEGGPLADDDVIRHTANEEQVGRTSPSPPDDDVIRHTANEEQVGRTSPSPPDDDVIRHTANEEQVGRTSPSPPDDDVIRHTANEEQVGRTSPSPPDVMTTGLVYDERMMEHLNLWDR
ncbi:hypothetical protein NHX12_034185 [Muraenolepis orangiensis]|uniref:Histone deacetylase domain-containing protein n=1 Tax=Muraenolepis orangiensis TaxID=630683 RepID=A0A9Q0D7C5_9TELE|nr:hypothetical protein NHX12_034185 [Muraenolepis orangiensis]